MSVERNLSRSGRGQEPRTPPNSGKGQFLFVFVDGDFVAVDRQGLNALFKRRQNDATHARLRDAAARKWARGERSADRRARRRLEKQMREWNEAGNRWVRVRAPRSDAETERLERQRQRHREKIAPVTSLSRPPRALPRYRAVIVDKAGRRGVFVDFIYDSASRNRFGVARRRVEYMFNDDHAELIDGQVHFLSNLGESCDEIIAAVTVAETANRSAQKNAKVGTNAIYQFAADLDQAGRLREMNLLARKYDALGLAYVMVPHVPSPGSNEHNFHVHVWSTTRPMERVGPYEWKIGQQLRTDCDGPDALYDLRRTWAEICTKVSHERGERYRYTHLGNAERGLPHRAQERLGKRQVSNWRKGKHEEAVAAMGATIAANEDLVAEIERRKAHEKDEAARTSSANLERPVTTTKGSRPAPARRAEIGEGTQVVPAPALAASPPIDPSMPLEKEKRPQSLRTPAATPAPSLKPTPNHADPIRLAPKPSLTAPTQISPVGTQPTLPALSAFAGGRPTRLAATPERKSAPKLGPTRRPAVVRLSPVSVPRPIALKPVASMPSPSSLSASPKRIVPPTLKPASNVAIIELAPVSRPGNLVLTPVARLPIPDLTPTARPIERPVLTATPSVTIPRLQPTASMPIPRLRLIGRPPLPVLTPTIPDPERKQRDEFTKRLLFGRLSLGLAIQGAQLAMTGERLAHGRAATAEEEVLLDRASLEVFAVDRAAALRAKATIGRLVALYIEREDRSDLHATAPAPVLPGTHSIGLLEQPQQAVAEADPPEGRPAKAMHIPPPTGASDTSASGGGMGMSLSRASDGEQPGQDEVAYVDWRFSDRPVDPLERIEWLFAYMRQNGRKRLVLKRDGNFTLPRDLVRRLELRYDDLAGDSVQARLHAEHAEQVQTLFPMLEELAARTDYMVPETPRWFILGGTGREKSRELADELTFWREEPVVHSALDTFGHLPTTDRESAEWERRLQGILNTLYPDPQATPRSTDEAAGSVAARQHSARPDDDREELEVRRPQGTLEKDRRYIGPHPGDQGKGR